LHHYQDKKGLKMENIIFTNHSLTRCQQRGISQDVVKFIIKYGNTFNTHEDKKFFINKKRLSKLTFKEKGFIAKNDKQILNTAVVCNKNVVVSAMKITNHVKWN